MGLEYNKIRQESMINEIELKLNSILDTGEIILSLAESSSKNSVYVLFRKGKFEYMPIRISDHPKNSFFSNKTFYTNNNEEDLLISIRHHLDHSDWYIFKYEDYFTLRVLKELIYRNLKIYIDNSMAIYDKSKMGLLFYQIRYFGRNHKEMNTISKSFEKYLRRLFSAGLINGLRQKNNDLYLYITQMGRAMICEYSELFEGKFSFNYKDVNLKYVEIPNDENSE